MPRSLHRTLALALLAVGALAAAAPDAALAERTRPELPPKVALTEHAAAAGERVTFWRGGHRASVWLSFDEYTVRGREADRRATPGEAAALAGARPVRSAEESPLGVTVALAQPVESREALRAMADAAAERGTTLLPILRTEGNRAREGRGTVVKARVTLKAEPNAELDAIAAAVGARAYRPTGVVEHTWVLDVASGLDALEAADALAARDDVAWAEPVLATPHELRAAPNDPLFPNQWHLHNTGQAGGVAGMDINVLPVWGAGFTGDGVLIGIVDDGMDETHPDLAGNARTDLSYDFLENKPGSRPRSSDRHGTAVAGLAGAVGNNGIGIAGTAPDVSLVGIRAFGWTADDVKEAAALSHQSNDPDPENVIAVSNNSWGPTDDGKRKVGPGALTQAAIRDAAQTGRDGLGTVFVWAGGNGYQNGDNVNYDGYANNRHTIAVGATGTNGLVTFYSEDGAALHVVAPGGVGNITTTYSVVSEDEVVHDYRSDFDGTSASAPIVAGIVALMLEANPALSWRDVQNILIDTARRMNPGSASWQLNGACRWFSHDYGFGLVDAEAAVEAALSWESLPPEVSVETELITVNAMIPDADPLGVTRSTTIDAPEGFVVESVEVYFRATHTYRGDLKVVLTSPSGTESVLARVHNDPNNDYDWTFTSNVKWGERADGTWSLKVADLVPVDTGIWREWSLTLHGYTAEDDPTLCAADLWILTQ